MWENFLSFVSRISAEAFKSKYVEQNISSSVKFQLYDAILES